MRTVVGLFFVAVLAGCQLFTEPSGEWRTISICHVDPVAGTTVCQSERCWHDFTAHEWRCPSGTWRPINEDRVEERGELDVA